MRRITVPSLRYSVATCLSANSSDLARTLSAKVQHDLASMLIVPQSAWSRIVSKRSVGIIDSIGGRLCRFSTVSLTYARPHNASSIAVSIPPQRVRRRLVRHVCCFQVNPNSGQLGRQLRAISVLLWQHVRSSARPFALQRWVVENMISPFGRHYSTQYLVCITLATMSLHDHAVGMPLAHAAQMILAKRLDCFCH